MSELERAAAEHARRQQEVAAQEARQRDEIAQVIAREVKLLRRHGKEFFAFARDHGATVFPRYDGPASGGSNRANYTRTKEVCVVAAGWSGYTFSGPPARPPWAITAEGMVYPWARVVRTQRSWLGDSAFAVADTHDNRYGSYAVMKDHFTAAASALLHPVVILPDYDRGTTGVQPDGTIGYRL